MITAGVDKILENIRILKQLFKNQIGETLIDTHGNFLLTI